MTSNNIYTASPGVRTHLAGILETLASDDPIVQRVVQAQESLRAVTSLASPRAPSDQSEDPAGTCLPTQARQLTCALQEHRQLVAAEIAQHLSSIGAETRRHIAALAHYDHVFELRLTGATSDEPATATERTPSA